VSFDPTRLFHSNRGGPQRVVDFRQGFVKILLDLKMLDVSQCCAEGTRGSVVQGSSVKRAFSPS
jgi:hypothetical protein